MTVALVSPQLRRLSTKTTTTSSSIATRLRRFVFYVWIVVITLHNISIVSNSAFNPSLIITTATSTSITTNSNSNNYIYNQKNMFRTVISSSTSTHGTSRRTLSGTALELIPLNSASLTTESSFLEESTSTIRTKASLNEHDDVTSPSKSQKLNTNSKQLRSSLKTRFGLFRRKLMIDDNSNNDNDDSDNDASPPSYENNKTIGSTPPPTGTTMLAATTTGGITYLNNNKYQLTIGSLFRGGGATAAVPTTTTGTGNGYYGIYGLYMILSKFFQTIFVQKFCQFANFVGTTKTRCFCLLVFSVVIESYATTLSKQAKDTGNALLFARACLVYLFCMVGFNISLAKIDVSVAYAVWSALGTTLVTAVGFFWFGESLDATKILYLGMIVSGVVGLNLHSSGQ